MKNLLQHIRIGYWLKCYFNSPKISIGLLFISLLMNVLIISLTNKLNLFSVIVLLNIVFSFFSAVHNITKGLYKIAVLQLVLLVASFVVTLLSAMLSS